MPAHLGTLFSAQLPAIWTGVYQWMQSSIFVGQVAYCLWIVPVEPHASGWRTFLLDLQVLTRSFAHFVCSNCCAHSCYNNDCLFTTLVNMGSDAIRCTKFFGMCLCARRPYFVCFCSYFVCFSKVLLLLFHLLLNVKLF